MKSFLFKDIKVGLYTDCQEYARDFFDTPDDAILDISSVPDSAGFSAITNKEIWIYVGKLCSFEELLSTVAHELGHLVTGGFIKNPPIKPRYNKRHEQKAEHYEEFVNDSYELAKIIEEMITK